MRAGESIAWSIDGVESTEAAAKAIPRDSIADISVNTLDPRGGKHIYVVTKRGAQLALSTKDEPDGVATRRVAPVVDGRPDAVGGLAAAATREQPLLLIDGTRSDPSVLKTQP